MIQRSPAGGQAAVSSLQLPAVGLGPDMNEVSIQARLGNQFLMSAPLDNVPAVQDQDLVGIAHRFQPVGNQDQSFSLCQRGNRGLEFASFSGSTLAVASSKITMGASLSMARAMERRCFSPPEREPPPSPKTVS